MTDPLRQTIVATADTIVVKIGTSVITRPDGTLHRRRLTQLCRDLMAIRDSGRKLVIVSSGAVGAGVGVLGLKRRPTDLAQLQAAAAVGQSHLMRAYEEAFRAQGCHAAQLLLTAEDFSDRTRYLNMRNTIRTLLRWGAVPVINENDTVSVEELRFGDNDLLAALVTSLLQAPLLILLSSVDGLLTRPPQPRRTKRTRRGKNQEQQVEVIPVVDEFTPELRAVASPQTSAFGTGGMRSKLEAARLCMSAGDCVILANGQRPGVLRAIMAGEPIGTLFLPFGRLLRARQRWLAFSARPRGVLVVDEGAVRALCQQGRSLLAVGIREVRGDFRAGDPVAICDEQGQEVARGLTNYDAKDLQQIKGLRTPRIRELLGAGAYDEVIHRDNLVLS